MRWRKTDIGWQADHEGHTYIATPGYSHSWKLYVDTDPATVQRPSQGWGPAGDGWYHRLRDLKVAVAQAAEQPVTCPSEHPVGKQNPLYEETTATGWFECEVCHLQYRPLLAGETCDMDGDTEDNFGGEHYWHCEETAVYQVRMPENHPEGVISGTTEMRLCMEHLEEVIFE